MEYIDTAVSAALSSNSLGYLWLVVAVLFLFIEIGTPGLFFFVAFAVGSCVASLLAFSGFSLATQCAAGLGSALIVFALIRRLLAGKYPRGEKTNVHALVGQTGLVIKSIKPYATGRVRVRSEEWPAKAADQIALEKGTHVLIDDVRGNHLVVKPQHSKE